MTRRPLILALAALALAACSPDAATHPLAPAAPSLAKRGTELPFRGSVDALETGRFSPPNIIASRDSGTGNATHLGRFAWDSRFTIIQNLATGAGAATGTAVLTAANGDRVFATFSGTGLITNGVAAVEETYIITGGTGRFAGAAGGFTMTRRVELATTGISTGSFDGAISLAH